ncbi:hypothetical protein I600_2331 [Maribacter dokdonensis DSW-8]|nr:hypothetical protein I600_2331 [Maribacter dokdonensis DSW-8]
MKGTIPNHAKKQMKNAIEVIQKVRMGKLFIFVKFKVVDFLD